MTRAVALILLALVAIAPLVPGVGTPYLLHVLIQIFIWTFIGQAWSLMGRFGLVSLGHGAFLGVAAYSVVLLWNFFGLTPWIGGFVAVLLAVVLAFVVFIVMIFVRPGGILARRG